MRRVEEEEADSDQDEPPLHLCIINLVIGTLYCSNGNFDFGISRIVKSFDPLETKLDANTWHYAKKCFFTLLQHLAKHMTQLTEARSSQILNFLEQVEDLHVDAELAPEKTISKEAAALGSAFQELFEPSQIHP